MNRKVSWVVKSVLVVSAGLGLNSGVAQAQVQAPATPAQIAMFDPFGAIGNCSALGVDCVDSIITQFGNTIGIGTNSPDPLTRLHVIGQNVFNPAGLFTNTGQAVKGVSTGGAGSGDVGVWGVSAISAGVLGDTNNPFAPGVLARNADGTRTSPGLSVRGLSDLNGLVRIPEFDTGGTAVICRNAQALMSYCSSSLRYKDNVQQFSGGLDIVNRLRPIAFTWKQGGKRDIGLAAEEVEKVEPLLTFRNDKGEVEGVKYNQLSAVFVNALAELQGQIRDLQAQLNELQASQREGTGR